MPDPKPAQPPASPSAQRPLGARLLRLWTYFSEYRLGWVIAIAGTLVSALTEASVPALLKPLLDEGFTQGSLPIWLVPAAIVGLFALRGFAHFASQYALARIANEGMVKLRRQLFDRLLAAELSLFSRQSASQLANTIVYEVQTGTTLLVTALLNLGRDSFSVVALMAYLLYLNWSLTLIVLVLVPIVGLIMKTMSRRLYRYTRLSQATPDELAYVVEENVLAHRMVRLHGAQPQQAARFDLLSGKLRGLSIKATSASAAAMPLAQMAAAVALSVVIGIALYQGQSSGGRSITVGGFVSFIGAMLMLIQPLRRLTDVVGPITRGLAALERGLDLMAEVLPEASPANGATAPAPRARGELALRDVTVAYAADAEPALAGIGLHVRAGETVALVGPSGSGKTTLVNAIINEMVLQDPTERVFIIEDTGEIQCAAENYVQYHTSIDVNMTALLKTTLRMRPDRILVGEVRGPEALDLLMAWNTGHEGGAATLHANNAKAGLDRLAMLISMHPDSPKPIEPLIGEAVHVVVHIARTPDGSRRIQEILEVSGYADGHYKTVSL